jgi:hypothetical protein
MGRAAWAVGGNLEPQSDAAAKIFRISWFLSQGNFEMDER